MSRKAAMTLTALALVGWLIIGAMIWFSDGDATTFQRDPRTVNDHVLHDGTNAQYQEYFKQEGRGDKNYLYTVTEFTDRWGRRCTVVTGDSERSIALSCVGEGR